MAREIAVRSAISGIINGQPLRGSIVAALDPDRGGRSACEFAQLPTHFTPGTFGTFT
jgi:hypothetical protein